jgi:hypothetical protein
MSNSASTTAIEKTTAKSKTWINGYNAAIRGYKVAKTNTNPKTTLNNRIEYAKAAAAVDFDKNYPHPFKFRDGGAGQQPQDGKDIYALKVWNANAAEFNKGLNTAINDIRKVEEKTNPVKNTPQRTMRM